MTTALIYLAFMVLVAGLVFLLASLVFGRGEQLPQLPPGASPTRLPAADLTGEDLRDVRFQLVLRGYKMTEVDWVLQRAGNELDRLRSRVAELEARDGNESAQDSAPPAEGNGELGSASPVESDARQ